jgi:hypothetical protein
MHSANLLEPWILLRLAAGFVALVLFARAARTSLRIVRHFDVARSTEGQLALERQAELSATLVRVATVVQIAVLALSMLAGDRLSATIRGAMCGYGVFHASPWGFRSLAATTATTIAAGVISELYALDARVRSFDLARPLAFATLVLAPLAALDFAFASAFALNLDLSVVASCCSVRLDASALGIVAPLGLGPTARHVATTGALVAASTASILALRAARRPRGRLFLGAALSTLVALPFALAACVLEVAPHAFELPQHVCPFCLLRPSVLGLGYPLFGSILVATTSGIGVGLGALLARSESCREALGPFARIRLRREAAAWAAAVVLGALPVARYAWLSGGSSLFR